MNETTKTIGFVVTAALLGLAAIVNTKMNQPKEFGENEMVGQPFFPDFTSTESAKALEVAAVDETGAVQRFVVENRDGLWRIPSHYDYPAEAAARIAQTAASVMGIERQSQVGMRESDFERFGVIDPLSESIEDPESVGQRITLKDENSDVLVDYIIGKEAEIDSTASTEDVFERQTQAKDFYVRRADESQTFLASLDVDLSTRFSDWIDPDLLRVNSGDILRVAIDNYKIVEKGVGAFSRVKQLVKDQGDQVLVKRTSPADPWSMDGVDDEKEALKTSAIDEILGVLEEMRIVGVRPKFKYQGKKLLTPELTLVQLEELKGNPEQQSYAIAALQEDLTEKGFNFGGTAQQLELVSENGELEFGTSSGILYRLHVGGKVAGDDKAIEIGAASEKSTVDKEEDGDSTENSNAPSAKDDEDNANRFLFVRVAFEESLLGDRPVEPTMPTEPVKPEGYLPAAEKAADKSTEETTDSNPSDQTGKESNSDSDAETDATSVKDSDAPDDARDEAFIEYDKQLETYKAAKEQYEIDLTRYKQDVETFEEKIANGKELVDELNERFGDWYYVISASNLKVIQSRRTDLVEIKAPPEPPAMLESEARPRKPDISFPDIPGLSPNADSDSDSGSESQPTKETKSIKSETERVQEKSDSMNQKQSEPPKQSEKAGDEQSSKKPTEAVKSDDPAPEPSDSKSKKLDETSEDGKPEPD
jgi:hypothetical protein